MRARVAAVALACAPVSVSWSCAADGPAQTATATTGGAGGDGAGGVDVLVGVTTGGPPPPQSLCGSEVHDVTIDAPALYFVLDASGSMADEVEDSGHSRSAVLHAAIVDIVGRLGDRARIGATVFPAGSAEEEACAAGREVFRVKPGDPPDGGDVTVTFAASTDVPPGGGTPTAATLEVVRERLAEVDGERAVILVTDGGPNCNEELVCGPSTCIPNIEGVCPEEYENCCDAAVGGSTANCLDRSRTLEAVSALREDGIPVHVIGIAGSAPFAATLGQMAILGGAPTAPPYYWEARDIDALSSALASIAVASGTCELALEDPPDVTWRTNVYLDDELIDYDVVNGWMWRGAPLDYVPQPPPDAAASGSGGAAGVAGGAGDGGAAAGGGEGGAGGATGRGDGLGGAGGGPEVDTSAVELRGTACERFKSAEVRRVTIVTGCPLSTPG